MMIKPTLFSFLEIKAFGFYIAIFIVFLYLFLLLFQCPSIKIEAHSILANSRQGQTENVIFSFDGWFYM